MEDCTKIKTRLQELVNILSLNNFDQEIATRSTGVVGELEQTLNSLFAQIRAEQAKAAELSQEYSFLLKQSQIALDEANIFRQFVEASGQGLGMATLSGQIIYVNPTLCRLLNETNNDHMVGKSIADYYPPETQAFFKREILPKTMAGGQWMGELTRLKKTGEILPTIENFFLIHDDKGQPLYLANIVTDITERKRIELAQQQNEAQLLEATQMAKLGHWEFDVERQLLLLTDQFYALYHTTAAEQGGYQMAPDYFARHFVHPDDAHLVAAELQAAIESDDPNYHKELEHRIIRADGELGYTLVRVRVRKDEKGRTTTVYGVNQDTTERRLAEEALAKQAAELQIVAEVSTATASILESDKLFQEVVDLTKERFGLYHAHLYLLNETEDTLNLVAGAGEVGRKMVERGWHISLAQEQSLVARAARNQESVLVNNVRAEPAWLPNPLLPHTRSELAVPLRMGNRILGILDVQADIIDHFIEEDTQILDILAAQLAVAVRNATLFAQTQEVLSETEQQAQRLTTLNEMAQQLSRAATEEAIFQLIARRLPQIVPADRISLTHLRDDNRFQVMGVAGEGGLIPAGAEMPLANTVIEQVITKQHFFIVADTETSDWTETNMLAKQGIRSVLSVPIMSGDEIVGTFNVGSEKVAAYKHQEANLLTQATALLSSALESRRLLAQVQQTGAELAERIKELDCLNDIGREIAETPPISEFLQWVTERIPPVMQHSDLCRVAITYEDETYGVPEAIDLPTQIVHGLRFGNELRGRIHIAYTEKREFLDEESALLGGIANRVNGYLESRRLFEQVQQTGDELADRIKELDCLNDIGREVAETPPVPEFLQWVTERIPPAMQHPELCRVAIQYQGQIFGDLAAIEIPSQIVHALRVGGDIVGRVYIAYTKKQDFINEESALLGGVARRVSGYIESQHLVAQIQETLAQTQVLYNTASRLNTAYTLEGILQTLIEPSMRAGATLAGIFIFESNEAGEPVQAIQRAGWLRPEAAERPDISLPIADMSLAGLWPVDYTTPLFFEEIAENERLTETVRNYLAQLQIRSGLWLPLATQDEWLGLVYIYWEEPYRFDDNERRLYTLLTTQATTAVNNRLLFEQTQSALAAQEQLAAEMDNQRRTLQAVLDGIPVGVFVSEAPSGRTLLANEQATEILGRGIDPEATADELGQVYDVYRSGSDELYPQAEMPLVRGMMGEVSTVDDMEIRRPDGRNILLQVSGAPIYDAAGGVRASVAIFQDITEQKVAEAEREQLLAEVEAAYRQYVRQEWDAYLGEAHTGRWQIEHQQAPLSRPLASNGEDKEEVRQTGRLKTTGGNGQEASIVAPISLRGEVIGTLSLDDIDPNRSWSDEELALVETVSEQLALTLENLRLFDETQKRAAREQLTREITDKMRASPDIDTIIETGLTELARTLNVPRTYVKLTSNEENE